MSAISVCLYLDKRAKSEDLIVKIRLSRDRKSEYIPIHEFRLKADEWDGRLCVNRKDARKINAFLLARLEQVSSYVREITLSRKAQSMTLKSIKDKAIRYMESGDVVTRDYRTFGDVWKDFIATKTEPGTLRAYSSRLSVLKEYCPGIDSLEIDQIRKQFVSEYVEWLRNRGNKDNTIKGYLNAVTGPVRYAVQHDELETYPLFDARLKKNSTRHRNVECEKLRKIMLEEHRVGQRHCDLFALSFLLRGMNLADMLDARKSDIIDGRLEYDRNKTGVHYSVKIEPEAQAIMDRYPSDTHLLSFLEGKEFYYTNTVNCALKKAYGVTLYHARHSVATIASDIDIPLDHIALILGHRNPERLVTLIYVNYDKKKADQAMRRIIDYVYYGKK